MPATATKQRPALTKTQRAILTFWLDHFRQHQRFPAIREACAKFGILSPNGVVSHLKALEKKGYLQRNKGEKTLARSYVVPGLKEAIASAVDGVKALLLDGPKPAPVMIGLADIDEAT
jgi:SOS-response transcriptional repressor LexA